jgi:2-dehydrotetronate isomerase
MLRFSANLGLLWPDRPLIDRIDAAARAGFSAVEMHWPYDVPAEHVATALRRNKISLLGINTAPGRFAQGERGLGALPGREHDFQASMDQAAEYCRITSATAIHAMAGNLPPTQYAAGRAVFKDNLRTAAGKAALQGLTILLEPLNTTDNPGYFYSTLTQAVTLIEDLAIPSIKLQFDVYHVARSEGDVLAKLERYHAHIGNVQIAAVPTRAEPDEGEINYSAIFAALERSGYNGWIGCEYKPRADTDAGLSWMRKHP